jgi:hypothetical protein
MPVYGVIQDPEDFLQQFVPHVSGMTVIYFAEFRLADEEFLQLKIIY